MIVEPRRAGLYLRQSKMNEDGIDRQRERTTALAIARGWAIVGEYLDNDVSASKPRGPKTAWGRMLGDADAGRLDVVIAVDLDRLLRSTRDLNTLIDHGLRAVTVDGEIDLTTADGEFRATMLAAIARFEVRRKGERQSRANAQRAAGGGVPKGVRLTGYESDGTVREDEASTVRAIFDGFTRGDTLRTLARRHGSTPSSIRTTLTNPRYAGRRVYKGEVVGTGSWSPLVDEATFDLVQARLRDPKRRSNTTGSTARKHLGSGLYRCECGDPRPVVSGGDGQRYRCRACGLVRRRDAVDAFVVATLAARLQKPDAADAMRRGGDERVAALLTEQEALLGRKRDLTELVGDGTFDADDARNAAAPVNARLAAIRAELDDSSGAPVLDGLDDLRERFDQAWEDLGLDRQRAWISAYLSVTLRRAPRGRKTFEPASVAIDPANRR